MAVEQEVKGRKCLWGRQATLSKNELKFSTGARQEGKGGADGQS